MYFLRILCAALLLSPLAHAAPLQCPIQPAAAITPADQALIAGDLPTAESLYTSQFNNTLPAFAGLVRVQIERNELPEALSTANKATTALPSSAAAQSLLGDAFFRAGKIPEASAAYLAALKLDPCNPRAHLGHARIEALVGRHTTAGAEFAAAHVLAPFDPQVTLVWAEALPHPRRGSAIRALLDAQPVLPPSAIDGLSTSLAIIEQQAHCKPVEAIANAKLDLAPLMYNGLFPRSWGLQTRINGKATLLLELDTAVDGIVLSPKDADKAGVRPLLARPTDPAKSWTGVAEHVRIGNLEFTDCPVRVVPASALANSNSLIGANFFRDHLIQIDYAARLLTLSPLPVRPETAREEPYIAPEEKDWSHVYISGPNVLVPTFINKKGPYLFLVDTGVEANLFSPAALKAELGANVELTRDLRGTSGEIIKVIYFSGNVVDNVTSVYGPTGQLLKTYTPSKTPVLTFAGNTRNDISSIAFDISPKSHEATTEVSGTLGFDLLSDFTLSINYRDSLAEILLDRNHRYAAREQRKLY